MTTDAINAAEPDAKPGKLTQADMAHLLRSIEHAITYKGLSSPTAVHMQPEYHSANLRFAEDDVTSVQEWAVYTGAGVTHDAVSYDKPNRPWHEYGTRPYGGHRGRLARWSVDLWGSINGPAPTTLAGE